MLRAAEFWTNRFGGDTEAERVAVINTGGDEAVNYDGSGVREERGAEMIDVA